VVDVLLCDFAFLETLFVVVTHIDVLDLVVIVLGLYRGPHCWSGSLSVRRHSMSVGWDELEKGGRGGFVLYEL
jgi:hypothetical protein